MSVLTHNRSIRFWALAGCLLWLIVTFFPLYWVLVTSFKLPVGVVGGATYLPFVDFEPTITAWDALFSGKRGEFFQTFLSSM